MMVESKLKYRIVPVQRLSPVDIVAMLEAIAAVVVATDHHSIDTAAVDVSEHIERGRRSADGLSSFYNIVVCPQIVADADVVPVVVRRPK